MEAIFKIILCHLIGDYFFQSPFLANTKGENWYHLFIHCMLYAIPFYLCFGWCWQLAVVTILHFPIDALKARWNKLSYVADQMLHYSLCFFISVLTMATLTKKDLLKEYIRKDFYWSNIDKYRKYFDEWYNNLTEIQLEFWQKRMEGQIC